MMTTSRLLPLAASVLLAAIGWTNSTSPTPVVYAPTDDTAAAAPQSASAKLHAPFDAILKEHVRDGLVDYKALGKDTDDLDAYIASLGRVDPARLARDDKMVFWINAYNAFTLRLILDNPKIDSIKDISAGKRWKAERWAVNGKKYSLDQIEHEILRPMGDARVHFALVCAALSCPDLAPEAYVAERLDEQLDRQGRVFVTNNKKGLRTYIDDGWFGGPTVEISAIFDWFEEDFVSSSTDIVDFVLPYASEADAAFMRKHRKDLDVEHFDYDWSLNLRSGDRVRH